MFVLGGVNIGKSPASIQTSPSSHCRYSPQGPRSIDHHHWSGGLKVKVSGWVGWALGGTAQKIFFGKFLGRVFFWDQRYMGKKKHLLGFRYLS